MPFTYSALCFSNQTSDKTANNTNNSTRENIPLETRTRSRQTLAVQRAGTTEPVPNPERLLRRTVPTRRTRSAVLNLSIAETTIYNTPKLGSPSDQEPNPFVENRADRSGPSLPGLFDISRNEPLATIVKEPNLEEASILSPEILGSTSNSQQPPQNLATIPPRNNRRMPSTLHMPLALSLSAPRWDGQARNLWTYIRLVERMLAVTEITDKQQKLRWLTEYIDLDINNQWTSFEEYIRGD